MLKSGATSFAAYSILQWANKFQPLVATLDQSILTTSYEKSTGSFSPLDKALLLVQAM
jgi:hypothetical protein